MNKSRVILLGVLLASDGLYYTIQGFQLNIFDKSSNANQVFFCLNVGMVPCGYIILFSNELWTLALFL